MNKKIVYTLFAIFILIILLSCDLKLSNTEENKELISSQDSTEKGLYAGVSNEIHKLCSENYSIPETGWQIAYTTSNVNVRKAPSTESEVVTTLYFNTQINVLYFNEEWSLVKINSEHVYFVNKKYISNTQINYLNFVIPPYSGIKTYMPYEAIKTKSSMQYKLQHEYAYTGQYGIRQVNGRFCVAIGTYFNAPVGTYIDLHLGNGTIIPCIVADIKSDKHTDKNNIATSASGCVSEFVCDTEKLSDDVLKMGDISYANENWLSEVTLIKVYDKNIFEEN